MLPASRSRGARERSAFRVTRLVKRMGRTGPVWLFLLKGGGEAVAAGVAVQAEGRLSATASQSWKTSIGGVARLRETHATINTVGAHLVFLRHVPHNG